MQEHGMTDEEVILWDLASSLPESMSAHENASRVLRPRSPPPRPWMADPNGPPAPFLPPEIISRILHFINPKPDDWSVEAIGYGGFAPLSRINTGWKEEAQKRLFEGILACCGCGEGRRLPQIIDGLSTCGHYIRSLFLSTGRCPDKGLLHMIEILHFTPNLTFLQLSCDVTENFKLQHHQAAPTPLNALELDSSKTFIPLLANLITLNLERYSNDDNAKAALEFIISNSPNVTNFRFENSRFRSRENYSGLPWTVSPFTKLKHLQIGSQAINLFPATQFKGLETLQLSWDKNQAGIRMWPFFLVVGTTLEYLSLTPNSDRNFPWEIFRALKVIERLTLPDFGPSSTRARYVSRLPVTLKRLAFYDVENRIPLEAWPVFSGSGLKQLVFSSLSIAYNFTQLPRVDELIIGLCSKYNLIKSLSLIKPGTGPFSILSIGCLERLPYVDRVDQLSEMKEIIDRCKELGIAIETGVACEHICLYAGCPNCLLGRVKRRS